MHHRLFVDTLRRMRSALIVQAAVGATVWFVAGAGVSGVALAIAFSMSLAVSAGPLLGSQAVTPREVLLLPVSRQEIWRTRWWISTIVTGGVTTTGKVVGLLLSSTLQQSTLPIEVLWLSSLMDLSYVGIANGLFPAVQSLQSSRALGAGMRRTVGSMGSGVALVWLLLSPVLPLAFFKFLPKGWSEVSAGTLTFIAAGLCLGVAAYFIPPRLIARPSPAANRAAWSTPRRSWPAFSNVTGLRRLVVRAWWLAAVSQAGVLVALPTLVFLMDRASRHPAGWLATVRDFGLLPFEAGNWSSNWIMIFLFGTIASSQRLVTLRHLRTLPFTTAQLNAMLVGISLTTWVNGWLFLAAFHFVSTGRPMDSWQLPMFFAFFGLESLARAINVRWQQQFGGPLMLVVAVGPVAVLVRRLNVSADLAVLVVGLAAVAAAVLLNYATLTRSRKAYAVRRRTFLGDEQLT